jgi:hypothetical protein
VKIFKLLTATIVVVILFKSCVDHEISDPDIPDASDASLFEETNDSGYTYYQSGNIISPAPESAHSMYKLRFNSIASQALDGNGELPENASFPRGSVLVKEVYRNSALIGLAVMKKAPTDANAGNGWLWAEFALDGTPGPSITNRGSGCISCHNDTPNRDLVRTFDLH